MNNETRQWLSSLDARILRLEIVIRTIVNGAQIASEEKFACDKCGVYNPIESGFVCAMSDCIQGLNPADDEE